MIIIIIITFWEWDIKKSKGWQLLTLKACLEALMLNLYQDLIMRALNSVPVIPSPFPSPAAVVQSDSICVRLLSSKPRVDEA